MLIKVKMKYYTKNDLDPKCVEVHVNGTHVGFVGPLMRDDYYSAIEGAPLKCDILVDGQEKTLLFKDKEDYEEFIEQVQRSLCALIPRL